MNRPESKNSYRLLGGGRGVAKHRKSYKASVSRKNRRRVRKMLAQGKDPGPNIKLNKLDIT